MAEIEQKTFLSIDLPVGKKGTIVFYAKNNIAWRHSLERAIVIFFQNQHVCREDN